ncbi:MAG: hypothetical protein ACXAC7_22250 [Candidatus Hodarchaeales archaeon]
MPQVQLNDRIVKVLERLMVSQKTKIRESMEITRKMETGEIVNTQITNVNQHKGFGGITYIVQANLTTSRSGVIPGGMVIKFCNNLADEVNNAERLNQLLQVRQQEWEVIAPSRLPEAIKSFPNYIYAPAVLTAIEIPERDTKCLMLEFVELGVPLIESQESGGFNEKLRLVGYALARLHGTKSFMTELSVYDPLFNHMRGFASEKSLTSWYDVLRQSMGTVEVIHGDSHFQNILRSGIDLAWIDAMLVASSDRFDDVGYSLSYLIQKEIRNAQKREELPTDIIKRYIGLTVNNWAPEIINGYQTTLDIRKLYQYLTLDFFIGTHLIIRSGLWKDETMKFMLKEIGKFFIEQWPINKYYGRI